MTIALLAIGTIRMKGTGIIQAVELFSVGG